MTATKRLSARGRFRNQLPENAASYLELRNRIRYLESEPLMVFSENWIDRLLELLEDSGAREWRCCATAHGVLGVRAYCRNGSRPRKGHERCGWRWSLDLEG